VVTQACKHSAWSECGQNMGKTLEGASDEAAVSKRLASEVPPLRATIRHAPTS